MFGLPVEVLVGLGSTVLGWGLKYSAQKQADNVALIKLGMERAQNSSRMADAASKRSSPWLRKLAATIVLLVAFGGILWVAFEPTIPVSIIHETGKKSFLGIFKWGGNLKVLQADGFVIAEWFKFSVISIVMFLFGTGAAKTQR